MSFKIDWSPRYGVLPKAVMISIDLCLNGNVTRRLWKQLRGQALIQKMAEGWSSNSIDARLREGVEKIDKADDFARPESVYERWCWVCWNLLCVTACACVWECACLSPNELCLEGERNGLVWKWSVLQLCMITRHMTRNKEFSKQRRKLDSYSAPLVRALGIETSISSMCLKDFARVWGVEPQPLKYSDLISAFAQLI